MNRIIIIRLFKQAEIPWYGSGSLLIPVKGLNRPIVIKTLYAITAYKYINTLFFCYSCSFSIEISVECLNVSVIPTLVLGLLSQN